MRIEKGKGIYLARNEARVHRNEEYGWDCWDPDFQVVLREPGECARFFPKAVRPDGKDGDVLFSLGPEGRSEAVSRSTSLRGRELSSKEYVHFRRALSDLREHVKNDEGRLKVYDGIRLPDPRLQPECYRLYGPFWNRRLLVLWGFDSFDENGHAYPMKGISETLDTLRGYIDPMHGVKTAMGLLRRLVLFMLIAGVLAFGMEYGRRRFQAYRRRQAAIPRCGLCNAKLVGSVCPNICVTCAVHNPGAGPCPFCEAGKRLWRGGVLRVSPIGAVEVGELVEVKSSQSGVYRSDDWPEMKAPSGQSVFYRWDSPGNYVVSWQPPSGAPLQIPVYVRAKPYAYREDGSSPSMLCASFLFVRTYGADGALEQIDIRDCSYCDYPGRKIARRELRWGEQGDFTPWDEVSSRKTARQLSALLKDGERKVVSLRVTDTAGSVSETSRILTVDGGGSAYPGALPESLELTPSRPIVGETVVCRTPAMLAWLAPGAEHSCQIDWGDGSGACDVPAGVGYAAKYYARPGTYEVVLSFRCDGDISRRMTGRVQVIALKDSGARMFDLSPPSIQIGSETIARDVSGLNDVVRREIRWHRSREYVPMSRSYAVQSFGSPGDYEVTMRLWRSDGTFQEESRYVNVVNDEWQVVLSVEPNPAAVGQEVIVSDMSVVPPGRDVAERQIRWFPSRKYWPVAGSQFRRVFQMPGNRKAVMRLLDDRGEFHYGQAGVTVEVPRCVAPVVRLSSSSIMCGQSVLFTDMSIESGKCPVKRREYSRNGDKKYHVLTGRDVLLQYDLPGVYHPELRLTCRHGIKYTVSAEVRVSEKVTAPPTNPDFEIVLVGSVPVNAGAALSVSYEVRRRPGSTLAVVSYEVPVFTVGGNAAVERSGSRYVFRLSPGGVYEIRAEVVYLLRDGRRGAAELSAPPIEPVTMLSTP